MIFKNTILFIVLVTALAIAVEAGSLCPAREDIFPCSCANIHQTKKLIHTIVNCHRIHDYKTLSDVFRSIKNLQIDQLHLYDIYAESHDLEASQKVLPTDWLTSLKVKEFEIVDCAFSQCFACWEKMSCNNLLTTRFTAINVTSSNKICTLCDTGTGNKIPWTGCMLKLKEFKYSQGQLTKLGTDFFPKTMSALTHLNFTRNRISKVDAAVFQNLPLLSECDLSHNALESLNDMFHGVTMKNLVFLDVSYNSIKVIGNALISLPKIKTFVAETNSIIHLKEDEWKSTAESIKHIRLENNLLHCDCSIKWLNNTFNVNTLVYGTCRTPEEYENTDVRRASRFVNERCGEDNVLGTRPPKTTKLPNAPSENRKMGL